MAALGGIYFLPLDPRPRLFLGVTFLFLVSSVFTLAKVVRDQQGVATMFPRRIGTPAKRYQPLQR